MSNLNTAQAFPNAINFLLEEGCKLVSQGFIRFRGLHTGVHLSEEAVHKPEGVLGRSRVEPPSIVLDLRLRHEASNRMTLFQVQQSVNFSVSLQPPSLEPVPPTRYHSPSSPIPPYTTPAQPLPQHPPSVFIFS